MAEPWQADYQLQIYQEQCSLQDCNHNQVQQNGRYFGQFGVKLQAMWSSELIGPFSSAIVDLLPTLGLPISWENKLPGAQIKVEIIPKTTFKIMLRTYSKILV